MEKKTIVKGFVLMLCLSLCLAAVDLIMFIRGTEIIIYLLAAGLIGVFFAIALRELRLGIVCGCSAILIAAAIAWMFVLLPVNYYNEPGMANYTTEVYLQFIARLSVFSFPVMLFGILLGSLVSDGV